MDTLIENLVRHRFAWLLGLLACLAFQVFFVDRAYVDLTIQVEKRTFFKIYWAGEGQSFSEKRMALALVKPDRKQYGFFLTDLKKVKHLRIDPQQYAGTATVEDIRIRQNGLKEIQFDSSEDFSRLKPLADIITFSVTDNKLEVQSSGVDPNFSYELAVEPDKFDWYGILFGHVLIFCLVVLVYFVVYPLNFAYRYIPAMLAVVLALAVTMALISEKNVHPDEFVHIAAAKYYKDHWLPPIIEDESIRDTYSLYGSSRLNTNEIVYLLNGKFARILAPLQLSEHVALRMFNILLLGLILLYTLKVPGSRLVAVPLLLSAQVWYLFSYCNSDAFALAISFFVGCQLVIPESALNRYLFGRRGWKWLISGLLVASLIGTLFVLKKNFYFYAILVLWLIFLKIWQVTNRENRILVFKRLVLVCFIGLSLLAVKKAADYYVNGFDRNEKLIEMRDKVARPMFNPNSPLDKQHAQLSMKERGVPLAEIIHKDRWFEKTFRSAFGVYGYFTISGSHGYYDLVRWTGVAFLIFFFASVFLRSGMFNSIQALSALSLAAALIAASLYHSWVDDFQAQGRYLIPILPMLGILCAQNKEYVNAKLCTFFVTCMFLLSAYSFICVALLDIPRMVNT
jgi:hypothetical protein